MSGVLGGFWAGFGWVLGESFGRKFWAKVLGESFGRKFWASFLFCFRRNCIVLSGVWGGFWGGFVKKLYRVQVRSFERSFLFCLPCKLKL